jgi:recombination DNA repair RAD52 pathway protein
MSGFTDSQVRALNRRVPDRHLKSRINAGRKLTYIEGWYALAQANRIFGLDGWDRESLETRCILAREIRGVSTAVYSARVRAAVRRRMGGDPRWPWHRRSSWRFTGGGP